MSTTQQEVLADDEVARRASRGAATYVLRTGASQVVQAASALAVARVLDPSDYGLFALALTLTAAVRSIGDLGIAFSLIARREISDADLRISVGVTLIVALVGGLVVSLIWMQLPLVAHAGTTGRWLEPALAMTLLIAVPVNSSTVVLERELKFARLGVIGVLQAVALFGTQVVLLLAGVGLWSLVIAQIVGVAVATVLTIRASGRLFLPSLRGPVMRLIRDGLPFGASVWTTTLAGTLTNVLVVAQLGSRGIGLFGWCTILAMPVTGALASVHSVSTPTLARMRRDDGSRYDESVQVVMRTLAVIAAVAAGCLIGLAHPTIRYIFGARWLPAATAVQFCLAGTVPTAILAVLAADANARLMRRVSVISAAVGAAATVVTLWPLGAVAGVGGAAAAAYCVGPICAAAVFVWGIPAPVTRPAVVALRLFVPLLGVSVVLGRLVNTPLEFAAACAGVGLLAIVSTCLVERRLVRRLIRVMRARSATRDAVHASAAAAVSASVSA